MKTEEVMAITKAATTVHSLSRAVRAIVAYRVEAQRYCFYQVFEIRLTFCCFTSRANVVQMIIYMILRACIVTWGHLNHTTRLATR